MLATAIAYQPGLHGPWLFDDAVNLEPIRLWLAGSSGWREVVFHNTSGPGGRPLAMASFLLTASIGGYAPFAFKLGNLLLHLANGLFVYALLRGMARRDPNLQGYSLTIPLGVAALWLLHPLLVSTTLYAVQRMAMLSASFMLLAMLAYLKGRELLDRDRGLGWGFLFLLVPTLSICAFYSKENGLIAPLLCGVIEVVYFAPPRGSRRPLAARIFLALGVAAPVVGGLLALCLWPERFLGGYSNRPFTLLERALTQPRVLFDYASSLTLPWGPRLSLFRDDYLLSTSLLSPPSTLLSLAGWGLLIAVAVATFRRIPALSAGLGIFLIGHLLESSVFPLLIYFEHRNYLPAIGLLWAMSGIAVVCVQKLAPRMSRPATVFGAAAVLVVFAFGVATHARATVWQDMERILVSSLHYHPQSAWVRMNIAQFAMDARPQRPDIAREHLRHLLDHSRPGIQQTGWMNLTAIDCLIDRRVEPARAQQLFNFPGRPIEPDLAKSIENVSGIVRQGKCEGLQPASMADGLAGWLDGSDLWKKAPAKSRLRYEAATLYAADKKYEKALEQVDAAWDAGRRETSVGAFRVAMLIRAGRLEDAHELLTELRTRREAKAGIAREFLDALQARLDDALPSAQR